MGINRHSTNYTCMHYKKSYVVDRKCCKIMKKNYFLLIYCHRESNARKQYTYTGTGLWLYILLQRVDLSSWVSKLGNVQVQ